MSRYWARLWLWVWLYLPPSPINFMLFAYINKWPHWIPTQPKFYAMIMLWLFNLIFFLIVLMIDEARRTLAVRTADSLFMLCRIARMLLNAQSGESNGIGCGATHTQPVQLVEHRFLPPPALSSSTRHMKPLLCGQITPQFMNHNG